MRTSFTRRAGLAATAMGVVLAMPAYAQESQDAGYNDEAIVVTARRMEENLQDVPISITVYSQEQLDSRNIATATDLASYAPGLSVNMRYGTEKSSFVIRGFAQELNTLPTVAVYFGDVVAPRLSSNITSGNGAGPGDMFDLQNVQVLKGPQGTLFGRNTTGGAILLVPKKPTGNLEGYIEGTYGNYDQRRVQGVLNVPLSDTFKIRGGFDWNKRDGYLNNRSGIGPKDFGDVNYFAARLSVLAELTPDLESYTIFKYAESDINHIVPKLAYCDTASASAQFLCFPQLNAEADFGFYDVQNAAPNPFVRSRTWQIMNTTTWDVSDTLTIKNIASYGEAREAYSFTLDGDINYLLAFPNPTTFIITNPGPTKPQGHQWTFSEELQLQGRTPDDRLTWQAGGYMEHSRPIGGALGQQQNTTIFGDCPDVYGFVCNNNAFYIIAQNVYYYKNYGLYAQATYDINEQFSVTGGFRYNWDWQKSDNSNLGVRTSPNGATAFYCRRGPFANIDVPVPDGFDLLTNRRCGIGRSFSTKSSKPTWLINLDYKPNDDILLYAKYARGYRGGGVNEANVGIETWDPEKVDTYELGAKTTWRGSNVRGTFNITGFWNDFSNQQASVFIPPCSNAPTCANVGINGIQNIGKSRMRGVEVETSFTFFDDFKIDVGYAYLDTEVREVTVPFCEATLYACDQAAFFAEPGARLAYAPKNRISVTGTYTLPLDESVGRVSVSATFTHTDDQYHTNSSAAAFAAGTVPFDAGILPSTDLLNLNLDWKGVAGSPIDLALFATNVTKEKYWVSSANGMLSLGGEAIILGLPRFYGMRVKFNFGE